jgi:chitin synthase
MPQDVDNLLMSEEDQKKLYYARQGRASTGTISIHNLDDPFGAGDNENAIQSMASGSERYELDVPAQVYQMNRLESIAPGEEVFNHK